MSEAEQEATIRIPKGATEKNVRDSLEKYLGDDYARTVTRLARLRRTDFSKRHGSYVIAEGTNALGAMRKLTSGAQTPIRITINGFRSLPLLIDRIKRENGISGRLAPGRARRPSADGRLRTDDTKCHGTLSR